jgi:replication-associated recombination protein RarA
MGFNYQMKTKKGYDFFEVASTLQKSIRRGDEETALYFAVELCNSSYDEYLWKRLKVICSEDVGMADPHMPATIMALYQMYVEEKRKKGENETLYVVHAIFLLCRAPKSRLVDWAAIHYWESHERTEMAIPDYAFDRHTQKGRKMGRGIDHFYNEGTMLANHVEQPKEAELKAKAMDDELLKKRSLQGQASELWGDKYGRD